MSLANLVKIGQLETIEQSLSNVERLVEAAKRALQDAKIADVSAEGRFDSAYRAIMQTANAALQNQGYRTLTSKPGHHATMIQTLTMTLGLDKALMIQLDALRKQRNGIDYSGDVVSDSMAAEALAHAENVISTMLRRLKEQAPG